MTDDDRIPAGVLWTARGLALLAYSGVLLWAPPVLAAAVMEKVTRLTVDIVTRTAGAWADDVTDRIEGIA